MQHRRGHVLAELILAIVLLWAGYEVDLLSSHRPLYHQLALGLALVVALGLIGYRLLRSLRT